MNVSSPAFVVVDPNLTHASGQNVVVGFDANTVHFFNSIRFGHTRYDAFAQNTVPAGLDTADSRLPSRFAASHSERAILWHSEHSDQQLCHGLQRIRTDQRHAEWQQRPPFRNRRHHDAGSREPHVELGRKLHTHDHPSTHIAIRARPVFVRWNLYRRSASRFPAGAAPQPEQDHPDREPHRA